MIRPKGLNIKDNDRNVQDGFLQESINLQWKDGTCRPLPQRLFASITSGYQRYIAHKVGDEDRVNILGLSSDGYLYHISYILDGELNSMSRVLIEIPAVTDVDSFSFTILNGIIYFMSSSQNFYYRVQYNEVNEAYEVKDMYAWKSLIPFYPNALLSHTGTVQKGDNTHILQTNCGIILIRFTLVLKTGEEVMHSPIYAFNISSINTAQSTIPKGTALENIHTIIHTNLVFDDTDLFDEEISAINYYASVPYYITETTEDMTATSQAIKMFKGDEAKGEVLRLAEEPFYLIKTLEKYGSSYTDEAILLYAGVLDSDIEYSGLDPVSKINMDTIAAGQVMPADNFTYHKVYGKITSNNGRLIINKPKTVLSDGHLKALATFDTVSKTGYSIDTEDGTLTGVGYRMYYKVGGGAGLVIAIGLLSYPDSRASSVGAETDTPGTVNMLKVRANKAHNMACAFNINAIVTSISNPISGTGQWTVIAYPKVLVYYDSIYSQPVDLTIKSLNYNSNNRLQFSESGEFSVWPAINSYRVGEGRIMFVGSNSIDASSSDYLSPLIIGTSEGVFTLNYDPSGNSLVQSITKTANLPALSERNVLVDRSLIYISDKGLIAISNGAIANLTENYFPEKGNGDFPLAGDVLPNYNTLTDGFFANVNPYVLDDIIEYMKGAWFAFDGRRNSIWCSNPDYNFSMVYNIEEKQWGMSTFTFKEVIDFNSTLKGIFSRHLVKSPSRNSVYILSGENLTVPVKIHMLTRPIKLNGPEQYKKLEKLMARCELYRDGPNGYFVFGLWGKQDLNKYKENIPFVAYSDNTDASFPNNVRQNIPIGKMMGKCKTFTILQGGNVLPDSSIDGFEFEVIPVENNILR